MATLKKGLFLRLLVGKDNEYLHDNWFIKTCVNMDRYVDDNNWLNFSHKGTLAGGVTKNPTYPLPLVQRTDTPDRVYCAPYSSPAGYLPRIETHALPYDKKPTILKDERDGLMDEIVTEGLWNCSPFENTLNTPIIQATGALKNGYRTITGDDIKRLRVALNQRFPALKNAKWLLILDTENYWDLSLEDEVLRAQMMRKKYGDVSVGDISYLGFVLKEDDRSPYYDGTTMQRLPYGAAPVIGTDLRGATAYVENKTFASGFGKAQMFEDKNAATLQGDVVSFLQHAYVGPFSEDLQSNLTYMGSIQRTP